MKVDLNKFFKKFVLLLFPLSIVSQSAGESTYQFLNIPVSPRQLALGGKTITTYDNDVSMALYNPSTINSEMDNNFSFNYFNYFSDISYGNISYAYRLNNRGNTLHFGLKYINYGDFSGYDELGNYIGEFTGNEGCFSTSYSIKLKSTPIYLGASVKIISSRLEQYNSYALATDIGAFYYDYLNDINISLVFRNIGYQIKPYNEVRESFPIEINLGISQRLQNAPINWHLTFENLQKWPIGYSNPSRITTDLDGNITEEKTGLFNELLRHVIIGVELFPKSVFNMQLGYSFRRGEELRILEQRNFSGFSFGFGIRFNKIKLNYSHSRFSSAQNINYIGLQMNLN